MDTTKGSSGRIGSADQALVNRAASVSAFGFDPLRDARPSSPSYDDAVRASRYIAATDPLVDAKALVERAILMLPPCDPAAKQLLAALATMDGQVAHRMQRLAHELAA